MSEEHDFLSIDEDALDEEWLDQPRRFHEWAEKLANARFDYEVAKTNLEVRKARLAKAIRSEPARHGLEKVTESAVQEAVNAHARHEKLRLKVAIAKHQVDIYQAAVDGLEHRKRALENLVILHGRDYFAEPKTRGTEGREAVQAAKAKRAARKKVKRARERRGR